MASVNHACGVSLPATYFMGLHPRVLQGDCDPVPARRCPKASPADSRPELEHAPHSQVGLKGASPSAMPRAVGRGGAIFGKHILYIVGRLDFGLMRLAASLLR